jgi:hypothetical protein
MLTFCLSALFDSAAPRPTSGLAPLLQNLKCGFIFLLSLQGHACTQLTSQIKPHSVFVHVNIGLPLHERTGAHLHLSQVRQFRIKHLAQEYHHHLHYIIIS